MEVVRRIQQMRDCLKPFRGKGKIIGFVPTMGYLHDGHLALVKKGRAECDVVVVSIFVNPLQFGPSEDYERYPRDEQRDLDLLEKENVDFVFIPDVKEMYPKHPLTFVEVEELSQGMCGTFRPGHFRGVATVVTKLFNIVQPDKAYFGEKDYQQLKVIERMVYDLNFPVEIVPVETVREADGLAMSSRNSYLSSDERKVAPLIYKALKTAKSLYQSGESRVDVLVNKVKEVIESKDLGIPIKIQYVEIRDSETLKEIDEVKGRAVLAIAAYIGNTRLIDNIILE